MTLWTGTFVGQFVKGGCQNFDTRELTWDQRIRYHRSRSFELRSADMIGSPEIHRRIEVTEWFISHQIMNASPRASICGINIPIYCEILLRVDMDSQSRKRGTWVQSQWVSFRASEELFKCSSTPSSWNEFWFLSPAATKWRTTELKCQALTPKPTPHGIDLGAVGKHIRNTFHQYLINTVSRSSVGMGTLSRQIGTTFPQVGTSAALCRMRYANKGWTKRVRCVFDTKGAGLDSGWLYRSGT